MKLRTRLMYLNLGVIILVTVSMVGYLLFNNYTTSKVSAIEQIELETQNIAKEMEGILNRTKHDAIRLGEAVELMIEAGGNDRTQIIDYLKEVIEGNKNYLYSWIVFEPNAFDQRDSYNLNKPGCDELGRFTPTWGRSGEKLLLTPATDPENYDYYRAPKQSGQFFITDPTTYQLDGKDVTTVTFCEPLFKDDKFIGVLGVDISLLTFREINSEVKFFENGFGRVISNKGVLLAHKDGERLNQLGGEFAEGSGSDILAKIESGNAFIDKSWSEYMQGTVQKIYSPINFEGYDLRWSYSAVVPYDEMMQKSNKLIINMIIIAFVAILFMGVFMYRNSSYVVKSVILLSDVINNLAALDLSFDENHGAVKFLDRKDETGDMTRSLATMQQNFIELIQRVKVAAETISSSAQELNATSEEVSVSAEEVANTVEELANGATSQAGETESGSNQINELDELMMINEKSVNDVVQSSSDVSELVEEGLIVIKDLIQKTDASGRAAEKINDAIVKTNHSADKISIASGMIASIAEQTNLLALNAAIEAARAGEAGRGFAVVAEEIRKLAEQSTNSTKEIDSVVEELMANSTSAVTSMEDVTEIVQLQVTSVGDTETKYQEISMAINSSVSAIEQMSEISVKMDDKKSKILEVIQSLSAIAEENAASTEEVSASMQEQSATIQEVASSSEKLSIIAHELTENVDRFKL